VDLQVGVTNLANGCHEYLSKDNHPNMSVSRAVRASSAVPLLFLPVAVDDNIYVDGGIQGNMPISAFPGKRALALHLKASSSRPRGHKSVISYVGDILSLLLNASQRKHGVNFDSFAPDCSGKIRLNCPLIDVMSIDVGVCRPFDVRKSEADIKKMIITGRRAAAEYIVARTPCGSVPGSSRISVGMAMWTPAEPSPCRAAIPRLSSITSVATEPSNASEPGEPDGNSFESDRSDDHNEAKAEDAVEVSNTDEGEARCSDTGMEEHTAEKGDRDDHGPATELLDNHVGLKKASGYIRSKEQSVHENTPDSAQLQEALRTIQQVFGSYPSESGKQVLRLLENELALNVLHRMGPSGEPALSETPFERAVSEAQPVNACSARGH
jgi:hypothetical protein